MAESIKTEEKKEEELIQFPILFPVKVMGLNNEEFIPAMEKVFRKHYPDFDESKNKIDYSKSKKYVSLTIFVFAQSKAELDALYMDLTSNPLVKVAF